MDTFVLHGILYDIQHCTLDDSKRNYNKKGLGSLNIIPLQNPHSKYVYVSANLLCLHCGRNGHLRGECKAWKESRERFSIYTKQKRVPRRGPGHVQNSLIKKDLKLPHWARNTLITSLSAFWELKLKWAPKSYK